MLLSRLSKLCLRRKSPLFLLFVRHLGGARFLSKTPLCHIEGAERCGSTSRDGDIGKLVICNFSASSCGTKKVLEVMPLRKDMFFAPGCGIEILEKTVPMDLMSETGTIGASHGWVATLKDGLVCLQDDLNPSASDSNPKRISLPPLVTLPHCQTQLVTNIAMSSSSPEDEDCIVAVKFLGPQLSLCKTSPKANSEWVNIRIEDQAFFSSRVMYSKRDKMFSMPASACTHTGSWDLEKHVSHDLHFPFYPEFDLYEFDWLIPGRRMEYLVEAPTGQTFMVKWYTRCWLKTGRVVTRCFVVFEILENEVAMCTKDIGDLCIFLSYKGEPFCLQASLYDLSPNLVYFLGSYDFGKFKIGDHKLISGHTTYPAPYFIPPQP